MYNTKISKDNVLKMIFVFKNRMFLRAEQIKQCRRPLPRRRRGAPAKLGPGGPEARQAAGSIALFDLREQKTTISKPIPS